MNCLLTFFLLEGIDNLSQSSQGKIDMRSFCFSLPWGSSLPKFFWTCQINKIHFWGFDESISIFLLFCLHNYCQNRMRSRRNLIHLRRFSPSGQCTFFKVFEKVLVRIDVHLWKTFNIKTYLSLLSNNFLCSGQQIPHLLIIDLKIAHLNVVILKLRVFLCFLSKRFDTPLNKPIILICPAHCVSLSGSCLPVNKKSVVIPLQGVIDHFQTYLFEDFLISGLCCENMIKHIYFFPTVKNVRFLSIWIHWVPSWRPDSQHYLHCLLLWRHDWILIIAC